MAKVKNKSHKGASKRFKITKNGKVRFDKTCNSHLMTNKGKNQKKHPYGKNLSPADVKNVATLVLN